nr:MAG TPA_asm: hypothetical protein [Caudoviricetes sp.]
MSCCFLIKNVIPKVVPPPRKRINIPFILQMYE